MLFSVTSYVVVKCTENKFQTAVNQKSDSWQWNAIPATLAIVRVLDSLKCQTWKNLLWCSLNKWIGLQIYWSMICKTYNTSSDSNHLKERPRECIYSNYIQISLKAKVWDFTEMPNRKNSYQTGGNWSNSKKIDSLLIVAWKKRNIWMALSKDENSMCKSQ